MAAKKSKNNNLSEHGKVAKDFMDGIRSDKKYKGGFGMQMADGNAKIMPRFTTGSRSIDFILGGGVPEGRIIEIYGPESSGKTTLALHMMAEMQKIGKPVLFVDTENAFDPTYAEAIGVDVKSILLSQPDSGEDALELMTQAASSGKFGLIVLDSVAALSPRAELEGQMGQAHVGLTARLMNQFFRKNTHTFAKNSTTCLFINQIRMKIGVLFGSPETTPGGNGLKFYSSIRIDVRRIGCVEERGERISNKTRVKVVKNKTAPPFRSCEVEIRYGEGIDLIGEITDVAMELGIIKKAGSWFSYIHKDGKEEKIGQGAAVLREKCVTEPAFLEELKARIYE